MTYDVVIVGSGASGSWAAKRLAEAGLRVAVLEAGRALADNDYKEHVPAFGLEYRGRTKRPLERERPRQSTSYAVREWNADWFVNDIEEPYVDRSDPIVPLGAHARRRRPHQHLGTRVSALRRHGLQGGVARRRRRRLADRLSRHRAVLRPRRGLRRRVGDVGGARRAARREVHAADGPHLRRDDGAGAPQDEVRPHADAGAHGEPHARRIAAASHATTAVPASTGASRTPTSTPRSRRWPTRWRRGGARSSPARWSTRC